MVRPTGACYHAPVWGRPEPELDLIARCCAAASAGGDPQIRDAAGALDWQRFLGLVRRHRVGGLVWTALSKAGVDVPAPVADALRADSAAITRQNLLYAAETARLQKRLSQAGISPCFFKGATLAMRAYGNLAHKHAKDIDFLIAPHEVAECVRLLEDDGYRLEPSAADLDAGQWQSLLHYFNEVVLVHAASGVQIEPHWRLTTNRGLLLRVPGEEVAQTIAGVPVATLGRDDLFAYLCAHGGLSGWFRLKWLADIDALIGNADTDEILRLHRHATACGAGPAATIGLMLCQAIFGRAIPSAIADAVQRSRTLRFLHRLAIRNLLGSEDLSRRQLALSRIANAHAHGAGRWEVWRVLLGSDPWQTPLPRRLHWLYPALRVPLVSWRWLRGPRSAAPQRAHDA